jgi:hypothetical protein
MTVIISVGHTSSSPGAVFADLVEFDIAKKIASETAKILKSEGLDVVIVPFDYDLRTTIDWINNSGYSANAGDISIDIHINDGGNSGVEGWYRGQGENDSYRLAKSIAEAISKESGLPFLGAKSEYEHPFGSLAFLHNTNTVSALIECGYLDNPVDSALMKSLEGIKKFARGFVEGIKGFLESREADKKEDSHLSNKDIAGGQKTEQQSFLLPSERRYGSPYFSATPADPYSERGKLIRNLYREVLGREADEVGLSYYLYSNPSATENDIRKEMTQSTEHFEILKNAKKAKECEEKIKRMEEELKLLRVSLEAKENEVSNMESLLKAKSAEIERLRKGQATITQQRSVEVQTPQQVNIPDIPMHSERKGCMVWLREIFGI